MTLKEALIMINHIDSKQADDLINEMRDRFEKGEDPEEILYEEGLEPDYVIDLLL